MHHHAKILSIVLLIVVTACIISGWVALPRPLPLSGLRKNADPPSYPQETPDHAWLTLLSSPGLIPNPTWRYLSVPEYGLFLRYPPWWSTEISRTGHLATITFRDESSSTPRDVFLVNIGPAPQVVTQSSSKTQVVVQLPGGEMTLLGTGASEELLILYAHNGLHAYEFSDTFSTTPLDRVLIATVLRTVQFTTEPNS